MFTAFLSALTATASISQTAPTEGVAKIFGLVIDPATAKDDAPHLLIATKYGLLRAGPDGMSEKIGSIDAAIATIAVPAGKISPVYIAGFLPDNTQTGLLLSDDNLANWRKIGGEQGLRGLVVSPLDENLMYALGDGIKRSSDGGVTWTAFPATPKDTFSLAPSSIDGNTLFAATMTGLQASRDNGESWQTVYAEGSAVTMVSPVVGNRLIAFIYGTGLAVSDEASGIWEVLPTDFEDRYLVNLVADPANPENLFASADTGAMLTSRDGGISWISFEGSQNRTPERLANGQKLFEDNCQECHGVKGIGEVPDDPNAKDEFGFKAPALNDDTHAWHHSDEGLRSTIFNGSDRNTRMFAREGILTDTEIDDILVYIKSLWSIRSVACQGSRHMGCMQ